MKRIEIIALLIFSLLFLNLAQAQEQTISKDTLWYLNGDHELIYDYNFVEEGKILNYKNKKGKHRDVETFFLFSINKSNGTKNILYKPTMEEEGDTLTVEEMNSFVTGGAIANNEYKARLAFVEGFVIGAASPFAIASLGLNPFYSIIIPAANSTLIGITSPCNKKIEANYPKLSKNAMFVEGYKQSAKRKRTKKSIVGGLIGMATGIVAVLIITK